MKLIKKIQNFLKAWLGCDSGPTVDDMIAMGMKVGENVLYDVSCNFDYSHCWLITIGNNVTFGPKTYLLAHDASTKKYLGYTKIGKVTVDDGTFIGASSIVMPGVHIGRDCIIGAYSVVTTDVPDNSVFVGNPARFICTTDEYISRQKKLMETVPVYDRSFTLGGEITPEKKQQMLDEMKDGKGFVV